VPVSPPPADHSIGFHKFAGSAVQTKRSFEIPVFTTAAMTLVLGYKKQMVEDKYDIDQLMVLAQQKVEETTAGSMVLKSGTTRIPSLMHTGTFRVMA
jgi:hypothetical protein